MSSEGDVDEGLEQLGDASDVGGWTRKSAFIYLIGLLSAAFIALAASVYFGYIQPEITLTATVDVGWVIEYTAVGLAASFVLFSFGMVLVALPGSMVTAIGSLAYGVASQQGYINDNEE